MEVREKMIKELKASDAPKTAEIDRLERELQERNKRAKHLSRKLSQGLQERDHALAQVEVERQATQYAKAQLEEEQVVRLKLREENAHREESLAIAQSHLEYLEFEAYRSEVVEEYRQGIFAKTEVAIACKAGFNYLLAQLPTEMRSLPDRFHYPPRVAKCFSELSEVEKLGGSFDLGEDDAVGDELGDEADGDSDRSTEARGEGPSSRKDGGVKQEVHSTPSPPAANAALPLTPRAGIDLS